MVEKVTSFRKVFDTVRANYQAKLQELVYPFVRWAMNVNAELNFSNFLEWKDRHVKSETWLSVYMIEKVYGTSLLLYISGMRSNNLQVLNSAKTVFSPLFAINNNPNYHIIDITTDYQDLIMKKTRPDMYKYLSTRKFNHPKNKNYHFSPIDERHEEFNQKGIRMFKVKSVDDLLRNFEIVGPYYNMRKTVMDEHKIKTDFDKSHKTQEYDSDIMDMRVRMRSLKYLSEPEKAQKPVSLSGEKVKDILNITDEAKEVKKNNLLKMIKHNTFFCNFGKKKLDIFSEDEREIDHDEEIRILLSMYDKDSETFEYLKLFWEQAKQRPDYDKKEFAEELLYKTFNFEFENDDDDD